MMSISNLRQLLDDDVKSLNNRMTLHGQSALVKGWSEVQSGGIGTGGMASATTYSHCRGHGRVRVRTRTQLKIHNPGLTLT
jgi:hypothetical protein